MLRFQPEANENLTFYDIKAAAEVPPLCCCTLPLLSHRAAVHGPCLLLRPGYNVLPGTRFSN